MEKFKIKVPENVRYISEWLDFNLPQGHCIIDKNVTGCGFTEYCLTNNLNVILCSPRKVLLENKERQHELDKNILYLKNELEKTIDFDKSPIIARPFRLSMKSIFNWKIEEEKEKIRKENFKKITEEIKDKTQQHYSNCIFSKLPCKILVTYDSLHYVLEALGNNISNFYVVVDEFQSIFLDSYFKSDVELDFVEYLQSCPNVIYLSATPMLDKYLEQLDTFKNLPYYELEWSSLYIEKVRIRRKEVKSLITETNKVIQNYKEGNFPIKTIIDNNGNKSIVQSKEIVIFCNNVSIITELIKRNSLLFSEVNIICSNTKENKDKIRKIGKGYNIGTIPLKGEPHKMFTFCTRTTYLGADFYSICASTLILSDANIDSLALDISLDLPQIIGRQRLRENVFKNDITIFYKLLGNVLKITKEQMNKRMEERKKITYVILKNYSIMDEEGKKANSKKYKSDIIVSKYSGDFIGVSGKTGYASYNRLIEVSHWRSYDVSRVDYQDSLSVTKALSEVSENIENYRNSKDVSIDDFLSFFFAKPNTFMNRMKMYCEFRDKNKGNKEIEELLHYKIKIGNYEEYYNFFGTDKIKSKSYKEKLLKQELLNFLKSSPLSEAIYTTFNIKTRYTLKEIKEKLREIYTTLHLSKTPKASDLEEFFEVKDVLITNKDNGKREHGLEILSIKIKN